MATTTKEFKHVTQTEKNVSCELDVLCKATTSRICKYMHPTVPFFNKIQNTLNGFGVTEQTVNIDKSILLAYKTIEELSLKLNGFDKAQKVYNFGLIINDLDRNKKALDIAPITAKTDISKIALNSELLAYITFENKNKSLVEIQTFLKASKDKEKWSMIDQHIAYVQTETQKNNIPDF